MKKFDKYKITSNNYLKTFFFGLVVISFSIIISENSINNTVELKETKHNISEDNSMEYLVLDLQNYLSDENIDNDIKYNSMYDVSIDKLNDVDILYASYSYLNKTIHLDEYNKIVECSVYNLDCENIILNTYITKELLNETAKKIFNREITNYTSFYTFNNNECTYNGEEYNCFIKNNDKLKDKYINKKIVDYAIYNDRVEIIEEISYFNQNNLYKSINNNEVGTQKYHSIFRKNGDNYNWESTIKIN